MEFFRRILRWIVTAKVGVDLYMLGVLIIGNALGVAGVEIGGLSVATLKGVVSGDVIGLAYVFLRVGGNS